MREQGERAQEVARRLKAGLQLLRADQAEWAASSVSLGDRLRALGDVDLFAAKAQESRDDAEQARVAAMQRLANARAAARAGEAVERERREVLVSLAAVKDADAAEKRRLIAHLGEQEQRHKALERRADERRRAHQG